MGENRITSTKAAELVGVSLITINRYVKLGRVNPVKRMNGKRIEYDWSLEDIEKAKQWNKQANRKLDKTTELLDAVQVARLINHTKPYVFRLWVKGEIEFEYFPSGKKGSRVQDVEAYLLRKRAFPTLQELANELGCSKQRIQQLIKVGKIKKDIEDVKRFKKERKYAEDSNNCTV